MRYDAPDGYDDLIAPRHAPVAAALVEAAALRAGEDVLELAPAQASSRGRRRSRSSRTARTARPTATPRCSFARGQMYGTRLQFVLADYEQPLPFLDGSFDVVLSSLTYVQTASGPVGELARVLRPGRRLALAMWGDSYLEVRMMSAARVSIGQPRFPRAAPGAAVRRLARRGFARVTRRDIELAPRFASVDDYMAYRHAFGNPAGRAGTLYKAFLVALRREAEQRAPNDGSLTLGWTFVLITALRSPLRRPITRRSA